MITIILNGRDIRVAVATNVRDLITHLASARGIAVSVNREVIPRSSWPDTEVFDGDVVEILGAAQGG